FPVQMMLLCVDNDHGVPNCSSELGMCCSTNRHIRDQVRDCTHLLALLFGRHSGNIAAFRNLVVLRIEILETLEWRFSLDLSVVVRNNQNGVAIEVRTGQTSSDVTVDTDGILGLTEKLLGFGMSVVHGELRDLELPTMRISDQHDSFTVSEV